MKANSSIKAPNPDLEQTGENNGEVIFKALLASFNKNADAVVRLFRKEAIIEFPYAASLGTVERLNLDEYHNYLMGGLPHMPGIQFSHVRIYPSAEDAYWAEVHGEVKIPSTGRLYQQNYVMYFTLKEGKINFYREYWDPIAGLKAFGNEKSMNDIFNKENKKN